METRVSVTPLTIIQFYDMNRRHHVVSPWGSRINSSFAAASLARARVETSCFGSRCFTELL
ncbi:hypothetical protein IF2G_06447 [Cordyceps javanica]|nr:hypothetical protein IF2G_06447 [Cordyceps javanica]